MIHTITRPTSLTKKLVVVCIVFIHQNLLRMNQKLSSTNISGHHAQVIFGSNDSINSKNYNIMYELLKSET